MHSMADSKWHAKRLRARYIEPQHEAQIQTVTSITRTTSIEGQGNLTSQISQSHTKRTSNTTTIEHFMVVVLVVVHVIPFGMEILCGKGKKNYIATKYVDLRSYS